VCVSVSVSVCVLMRTHAHVVYGAHRVCVCVCVWSPSMGWTSADQEGWGAVGDGKGWLAWGSDPIDSLKLAEGDAHQVSSVRY